MKKFLFLLLIFCQCTLCALADDVSRIKSYSVGMVVHEDNTFDISEMVTVHFATPMHGFYRYVPLKNWMMGKSYTSQISLTEVTGDQYVTSYENDNLLVKIGNPDVTITGDKDYQIDYLVTNRDDRVSDKDMFNHSIIGKEMGYDIDTLRFAIAFDKHLPADAAHKLNVYSGEIGCKENRLGAEVWFSKDTIYGYVLNVPQKNPVTLELTLPEGYYQGELTSSPQLAYIFLAITLVLCVILLFFELTVKHPLITKQIEFYPPEGMCSAEVGTIIDDSVDNEDLASLIPWFASQGYLTIAEKEEKALLGLSTKKYLEITKVKGAAANMPLYQRTFFSALFSKGGDTVRLDKLPKVDTQIEAAKKELSSKFTGEHKLTSWHWAVWLIGLLFAASSLFMVATLPCDLFEDDDYILFGWTWCTPFVLGAMAIINGAAGAVMEERWMKTAFFVLRCLVMIAMLYIQLWMIDDIQVESWMVILVFVACFAVVELAGRLNIDSAYRVSHIGELLGLKEFIETAEEPRLKSLLEDDPEYFYRVLPYAMVFGVSTEWADHFKNIKMEQPEWYSASPGAHFMANDFVSSIKSASDSAISCMSPSSSGSGGSGGGTGGGGGGGW